MSAEGVCHVAIVGLGVSSIQLVRQLNEQGIDFLVFTERAFGIWSLMHGSMPHATRMPATCLASPCAAVLKIDAGEDFDLVTTIESTNFHDMEL